MDIRLDTDTLAQLIEEKLAVLQQLRELARRQATLIAAEDMTRLLAVLSAKQTLLTELQRLQQQLRPYQKQAPEQRQWSSSAQRTNCQQTFARCECLLEEIMLVERQSELELQQRRDVTARQLQAHHSAAHATRAYLETTPTTARRLDICSES